jgi:nucleotide-binding universal stress UspA family protein
MTPLHRIALMTQWTEFDAGAERVALELAQRLKLPLTLIVPLLTNPELEVVAQDLVAEAEAATARSVDEFQARARTAGVTAEIRVRRGDELWREVVDEARAAQADLIVTRRRGHRSFFGKLHVGEMVRQIAAHAPCPLMVVPRRATTPAQRVVVAVDAESDIGSADEPIASAAVLASMLGLALEIVAVSSGNATADERWLQRAETLSDQWGLRIERTVVRGRLTDAVASRLRERPADLLALGIDTDNARHGRLGDAVEAIVGESACATLLVRTQARSS